MFVVDVFSTSLLCYLALSITDKTFLSSGRFFTKYSLNPFFKNVFIHVVMIIGIGFRKLFPQSSSKFGTKPSVLPAWNVTTLLPF